MLVEWKYNEDFLQKFQNLKSQMKLDFYLNYHYQKSKINICKIQCKEITKLTYHPHSWFLKTNLMLFVLFDRKSRKK